MSLVTVRKLLEVYLNTNSAGISTAFENAQFTPVRGTAWQACTLLPARAENPTLGAGRYRQSGVLDIALYYPTKAGTATALGRAETLRAAFACGTTLTENQITVRILKTPSISPGRPEGEWYVITVSVPFVVDIG